MKRRDQVKFVHEILKKIHIIITGHLHKGLEYGEVGGTEKYTGVREREA